MKLINKIIIFSILGVPLWALLDTFLIRGMGFEEYLYVCSVEVAMFLCGMLAGIKIIQKENKK
jgi:hypothetical protein